MSKTAKVVYWVVVVAVFVAIVSVFSTLQPDQAHAANITTSKTALTTQASKKAVYPYSDVTNKTVDKVGINAVTYVKNHKGFKGVITGNKFYPKKTFTKAQFLTILENLYGTSKVPVTLSDVKTATQPCTGKYVADKLSALSKNLGYKITWKNVKNVKLLRTGVASYINVFCNYHKKLRPRQ